MKLTELFVDAVKTANDLNELGFALDSIALNASEIRMSIPERSRGSASSSSGPPPAFVQEQTLRSRTPSLQADFDDFEAETEVDEGDYIDTADRRKRLLDRAVRKDDIDDSDLLDDAPPEQLVVYSGQPTGSYETLYPQGMWVVAASQLRERRIAC